MTAMELSRSASPGRAAKNPQELVAFLREKRSSSRGRAADQSLNDVSQVVAKEVRNLFEANQVDIVSAFRTFDEDGNNTVDRQEFRRGMHGMHLGVSDAQIDQLLEMVDKDGDGQVGRAQRCS